MTTAKFPTTLRSFKIRLHTEHKYISECIHRGYQNPSSATPEEINISLLTLYFPED